jgi:hypothetical protein
MRKLSRVWALSTSAVYIVMGPLLKPSDFILRSREHLSDFTLLYKLVFLKDLIRLTEAPPISVLLKEAQSVQHFVVLPG